MRKPKNIHTKAKRKSVGNIHATKVYPSVGSPKTMESLKTIGLLLSPKEQRDLALLLLTSAKTEKACDVTAHRDTHQVTVTIPPSRSHDSERPTRQSA